MSNVPVGERSDGPQELGCRDLATLSQEDLAGSTLVGRCAEEEVDCTGVAVGSRNWVVAEDGSLREQRVQDRGSVVRTRRERWQSSCTSFVLEDLWPTCLPRFRTNNRYTFL